jgi:hypothetical protein
MIEQLKTVVCDIPRSPQSAETIRVSIVMRAGHRSIDLRVYLAGHPTEHGVSLREDLVPELIAGLRDALDGLEHTPDSPAASLGLARSGRSPDLSWLMR